MKILAGRLNRRVDLLRPVSGLTAAGSPFLSFVLFCSRWCARLRFSPATEERDPQRQASANVQLLLRLDADTEAVTTEWRLRFDGVEMLVTGVDNEPADGSQVLTCTAVLP